MKQLIRYGLRTKGLTHMDFRHEKTNEELRIINLHAPFKNEDATTDFIKMLLQTVKDAKNASVIAAGDYNSRSLITDQNLNQYTYAKDVSYKCT